MSDDIKALQAQLMKAREDDGWFITGDQAKDFSRALTALVAERDALARENEAQTYEGNSVIYWSDRAKAYGKCIDAIWCVLSAAGYQPDGEKHIVDTLTALVAERDGLRKQLADAIFAAMRKGESDAS